jgi:hypothetical protein
MYKRGAWPGSKQNKYGGSQREKIEHKGFSFDSKLEAALYDQLLLEERAGEITDLHHHPGTIFLSAARIQYRPDFSYTRTDSGKKEWAEAKGFANDRWPTKKKLWKHYGPGVLKIYGGSYRSLKLIETVIPQGGDGDGDIQSGRQGDSHSEKP